jgi:hypothetical protein
MCTGDLCTLVSTPEVYDNPKNDDYIDNVNGVDYVEICIYFNYGHYFDDLLCCVWIGKIAWLRLSDCL